MRKNFFVFIATVAAVMTGCSKEDVPEVSTGIPMTINVSIGDAATKTTYTPDGGALKVEWEAGDQISIVSIGSDNIAKTCDTFTASAGGSSAEFTGTYTGAADAKMIRVFYPALTETGTLGGTTGWVSKAGPGMYDGEPFFVVSNKDVYCRFRYAYSNQLADGDPSHLKYLDSMSATIDSVDELGTVLLTKNSSVIRLVINTSAIDEGWKMQYVELKNISRFGTFEPGDWHYTTDDYRTVNHGGSANIMIYCGEYLGNYNYSCFTKTSSDNDLEVFIPFMGNTTLKAGDEYTVTVNALQGSLTKKYTKTVTLPSDIVIPNGSCLTISATVAE